MVFFIFMKVVKGESSIEISRLITSFLPRISNLRYILNGVDNMVSMFWQTFALFLWSILLEWKKNPYKVKLL